MKNTNLYFFVFSLFLLSCSKPDPKKQVQFINGYWEIEKVEVSPDSIINYSVNQNIDYFEIEDRSGQRTKLSPQVNGTFKTTNSLEKIDLKIEDDSLRIYYKTPFDHWKETVLEASAKHLVIINDQDKIYHYKKYSPLNIETNEKE